MQGTIVNFRQSRHVQKGNHIIISVASSKDKKKAASFIGKEASWKSPAGKEIKGKIVAAHGNSGAVRAIFERGLPGQAVGTKIEIN